LEAQAASALEHPHIAVIHEVDETEGFSFIGDIDRARVAEAEAKLR
jgi:hypothetical protein